MPQLIPPIPVDSIEPFSERKVIAELVAQLPKDCRLYHNFEFVSSSQASQRSKGKELREGEIDAVVLWPDKGLLVLEIKGGQIDYCEDSHSWSSENRYGRHNIKDPLQQARSNMHELLAAMKGQLKSDLKDRFTHGYAVIFPTSRTEGALPHSIDTAIICDATKLKTIGRFIDGALKSWRRNNHTGEKNSLSVEQIHRAMLPAFRLVPSLQSRVNGDIEVLLRLTEDQHKFLDFAANLKRLRVDGVAGSGKTLLAVEQCRRYAREGKRTLLLCYNKSLGEWLTNSLENDENAANITVKTFHEFCEQSCAQAGIDFQPENTDQFWQETTAELLAEATESIEKFDAIIVDEGQDFYETWWLVIEDLLAEASHLMIFCDPNQDIFGANGLNAIDVEDRKFELPTNCRNTQNIASFCNNILDLKATSHQMAPPGIPVDTKVIPDDGKRRESIQALVSNLIKDEGLSPSQVAIISPWRKQNTCLADVDSIKRIPLVENIDEWGNNKGVLIATIRSFKGLEADVLILIDTPTPGEHKVFGNADFYVGCSRAKSVLYVLAKSKNVSQLKIAA